MRSSYKRIGDYIKLVKVKNDDGSITELLGINIDKFFMPSVANVVGTDLKKYKVVKPNQFSCNRMHVGRDKKLPIALSKADHDFIVSPAYDVFQIKDINKLLPQYLMMWFSRPEFDRNSWFYTDTDVRGKLGWDSFCDMKLPIPSLTKQQEIADEYNTIINRIKLNEKLNGKLEETAQAIYKEWFVDFEFPMTREYAESIGQPELEGKAYKANGGELVYNEELEQEIPVGWEIDNLGNITDTIDNRGKTPPHLKNKKTCYSLLEIASLKAVGRIIDYSKCSKYVTKKTYENWFRSGHPREKDILFSTVGSLAQLKIFWGNKGSIAQNIVAFRAKKNIGLYIYQYLINSIDDLLSYEIGSVQASIKVSQVIDYVILIPNIKQMSLYEQILEIVTKSIFVKVQENLTLSDLKQLLLKRISKVED